MWNDRFAFDFWERARFDPMTLTVASMATTAAAGGVGIMGTLAGGQAAQDAAKYKATQLRQNESQVIASSQRKMLDTQEQTRFAQSTLAARAGGAGVNAGTGSPATMGGEIAQRGSYHALMDLFQGQSAASGLENEARGAIYTGDVTKKASYLAAGGEALGTVGSELQQYGRFKYPSQFGSFGANF